MVRVLAVLVVLLFSSESSGNDYLERPEVDAFISDMVRDHGFSAAELRSLFAKAQHRADIIEKISRPAEVPP